MLNRTQEKLILAILHVVNTPIDLEDLIEMLDVEKSIILNFLNNIEHVKIDNESITLTDKQYWLSINLPLTRANELVANHIYGIS